MKKLILLFTLLLSLVGGAQGTKADQVTEKTQFVTNYSEVYVSTLDKWSNLSVRILWNYNNNPSKIKIFIGTEEKILTQFVNTQMKTTPEGIDYYELKCKDAADSVVVVQYFIDGVKLIFDDSSFVILLE